MCLLRHKEASLGVSALRAEQCPHVLAVIELKQVIRLTALNKILKTLHRQLTGNKLFVLLLDGLLLFALLLLALAPCLHATVVVLAFRVGHHVGQRGGHAQEQGAEDALKVLLEHLLGLGGCVVRKDLAEDARADQRGQRGVFSAVLLLVGQAARPDLEQVVYEALDKLAVLA